MLSKVRSRVRKTAGRKRCSRLAWTALTGVAFVALAVPSRGVGASALTERVSVSSTGGQGDGDSSGDALPAISGDGRYVAFDSLATNLVPGDTNGFLDMFARGPLP